MLKYLRTTFSAAVLLLWTVDAMAAFCLPKYYYRCVGDHATDIYATDPDIPTAITNAVCPNTVITITHEKPNVLTGVALEINGKSNLTLIGLPPGANCNSAPPTCDPDVGCNGGGGPLPPQVALYGTNAASVLYIHGNSSVTLESLQLYGGGNTTYGGGIHFTGTGSLTLIETTIYDNNATYGGGIQFNGSGGFATLTLGAGTLINSNGATSDGGGIHINGTSRLFVLKPYTYIFNNTAVGHGGGIEVVGPARADIASPGLNGAPVVDFNKAAYGGGISIDADQAGLQGGDIAKVRVFSVDSNNPVQISNNTASHTGGGIYLKPYDGSTIRFALFCASDFRIDHNIAQEGSAIYADEDYDSIAGDFIGGSVRLNADLDNECSTPEPIQDLGGVACAAGATCNTISGNVAEDSSNQPTAGSAILAQTNADLQANRFVMRDNHGAHAIRSFGPDPNTGLARISNCLIADNTLTAEMIRIEDDGNGEGGTTIDGCTIVNNGNQGAPVIYSAHALTLTRSIIDELSINTLNYVGPGGGLNVSNVLATDISTLPSAAGIDQGQPLYVDAAHFDYHLQPTSTGIDFAPANGGQDLDGNPRDVNLSGVPGNPTPRDIGAYERQNRFQCGTSDSIFCNGYEYSW
ncbi:MAG TPA: hypothetical protein VFI49_16265 [Rudaea sp.]|nr:hypothetical protein [Rudaea sp.]